MLNWWDYLDSSILEQLSKNGFTVDLGVYRSNDVAVSKLILNKEEYDVAILSNQVIDGLAKSNILMRFIIENNRTYYAFLNPNVQCVPFMWSTTVFAVNKFKNSPTPPIKNIHDLIRLTKSNYSIGIIDDRLEVAMRVLGDEKKECRQLVDKKLSVEPNANCGWHKLAQLNNFVTPSQFVNSIYEVLKTSPAATYGWHGAVIPALTDVSKITLHLPQHFPVVGYDAVCIINKPGRTKAELEKLKKLVEILTSEKSAQAMAKKTQYFSPYKNDTKGLTPLILKLHKEILAQIDKKNYQMLTSPTPAEHDALNKFWKKLRYE